MQMSNLSVWDRVLLARMPMRPTSRFYLENVFDSFEELHV